MADAISATLGYGSVAGSSAAPVDIITFSGALACNFLQLTNQDATNWLFAKAADDPGPYMIAAPGQVITIARGPQSANNLTKIKGWGASPSNGGAATVLVTLLARKLA